MWNPINDYQLAINISSTIQNKIAALKQHITQNGSINYVEAIQGLARYCGAMSMSGDYAEVFEVIKINIQSNNITGVLF